MPRDARRRILLIFLIIRYTGAKLNEVLNLDPSRDFDFEKGLIILNRQKGESSRPQRKVQVSAKLGHEIRILITDLLSKNNTRETFHVDPGFVRGSFMNGLKPAASPSSWALRKFCANRGRLS
jgi:molybdate transport system regulatory protein